MATTSTAALEIILRARDDASKSLGQVEGSLGRVKGAIGTMAKAAAGLAVGAAAGLAAFGASAIKTAGEFESEMAIMSIAARQAGASVDELREFALKMGADTFFSASEAAEAMTNLFKAGLSWEEVQSRMVPITDLASASSLGLAQAADAVNVAMATFGEQAGTAEEIVNSFVGTADASVAEVEDLTAALAAVGPTAASFGWSMQDVNTALAVLSERGIAGSEAGTALKSMMTNLMRPTDDVTDTLNSLGVELYDAEGHLKALPDLIGNLSQALYGQLTATVQVGGRTKAQNDELTRLQKIQERLTLQVKDYEAGIRGVNLSEDKRAKKLGELRAQLANAEAAMQPLVAIQGQWTEITRSLTDEQRNQAIQTLAGTYGMKAMNTLLAEGVIGWEEMEEAIGEAASAQEVAAARMDTFAGAVETLKGGLETLLIRAGLPLINNFARPLVEFISDKIMPAFDAWAQESLPMMIDQIMNFGRQAKEWITETALPAIQGFIEGIDWEAIKTSIAETITKIVEFGAAAKEWIEGNATPILAGLAAMVGTVLVAAFVAWSTAAIAAAVATVAALAPVILPIAAIGAAVALLVMAWENDWGGMRTTLTEVWEEHLQPAFEAIGEWLEVNIPAAIETLRGFWEDTLQPAMEAVWAFIEDYLLPLFEALANVAEAVLGLAVTALAGLWQNVLQPALSNVWAFIQDNVIPILKSLAGTVGETVGPKLEGLKGLLDKAKGAFDAVKGAISSVISWLDKLASSISAIKLPDWLTPGSATPFELGLLGIADAMSEVVTATGAMVQELAQAETLPFAEGGERMGESMMGGLSTGMEAFKDIPLDTLAQLLKDIAWVFEEAQEYWDMFLSHSQIEEIGEFGQALMGVCMALETLGKLEPAALPTIENLALLGEALADIADWMWDLAKGFGGDMAATQEFADMLRAIGTALSSAVKGLLDLGLYQSSAELADAAFRFRLDMLEVLEQFKILADEYGLEAGALDDLIEIARDIGRALNSAVDGLLKLDAYTGIQDLEVKVDRFIGDFKYLWTEFADAFGEALEDLSPELTELASLFWAAMSDFMGALEAGLEVLIGVQGFVPVTEFEIFQFVDAFHRLWLAAVDAFAGVLDDLTPEFLDLAGQFWQVMSDFLEAMKTALEVLEGLVWYVSPMQQHIEDFMADVGSVLAMFQSWATGELAGLADEAMMAFAETVGAIFSGIGEAVGTLQGILAFAEGEEGSFAYALGAFNEAVTLALESWQIWLVDTFSPESLGAIEAFWEACGDIWTGVKDAVTSLAGIAEFEGVPADIFTDFAQAVREALTVLDDLAEEFGADSITAAEAFLAATIPFLATLRAAVDNLLIIETYADDAAAAISALLIATTEAIDDIFVAALTLSEDGVEVAGEYLTAAQNMGGDLRDALGEFGILTPAIDSMVAAAEGLKTGTESALDWVRQAAEFLATEGVGYAQDYLEAAREITATLAEALLPWAGQDFGTPILTALKNARNFKIMTGLILKQLEQAVILLETVGISLALRYLEAALAIVALLRRALVALSSLIPLGNALKNLMNAFNEATREAVNYLGNAANILAGSGVQNAIAFHNAANRIQSEIQAALNAMRAANAAWKESQRIAQQNLALRMNVARINAQAVNLPAITASPTTTNVSSKTTNVNVNVSGQNHVDRQQAQEIARALGQELRLQGVRV